jgi:tetratricopeptide (TPR) repeat protein
MTNSIIRPSRTRLAAFVSSTGGISLSIALVTLAVFSPALWNGFVEWDDQINFLNNPHYRGLGWPELRWMFTTVLMGHWIPLTWLTFGMDYLVWGMNPGGYHLTNLLLHAVNASVFYLLALRLLTLATTGLGTTALRLGAAASALFFALHPLRAESVAWVTERRDVLSGLFFLFTVLTYLKACEAEGRGRRRWLAGSVGLYALSLSAKSIGITLPFVLILLDIYPLRRLGPDRRQWTAPEARVVWAEKLPYLLLALAAGGMALYAMTANSFLTPLETYSIPARVAMALYSLWFYLWKSLVPFGLSPLYELPAQVNPLEWRFLASAVAAGAITLGFFLFRRRWPAGLAVWVYYAITLAPASGIVHNGHQLANDRYSYLSCLGWALLVGLGVGAVVRAKESAMLRPALARFVAGGAALWFIGLGTLTWHQVQVWRDTDTLWRYALESDPNCSICRGNLGSYLANQGYPALAIEHLERALALRPDRPSNNGNLALALGNAGRISEAIGHFEKVLERRPNDVDARNNLAVALIHQGRPGEAIQHLKEATRLNPVHALVHANLGTALTELGNPEEAIEHYRRSIELKPEAPLTRYGLMRAYLALGKTDSAREEHRVLEKLDPRLATQLAHWVQPPEDQRASER